MSANAQRLVCNVEDRLQSVVNMDIQDPERQCLLRYRVARGVAFMLEKSNSSAWVSEPIRSDFTVERMKERVFDEGWHLEHRKGDWTSGWPGCFYAMARAVYYLGTDDLKPSEFEFTFVHFGLDVEQDSTDRKVELEFLKLLWRVGASYAWGKYTLARR